MSLDVLLVQDNPILARLWEAALKAEGFQVRCVHCGMDGFEIALDKKPRLILVDALMPEVTGFDFCRSMEENPELTDVCSIIFVSHFNLKSAVEHAKKAGAEDYWLKYDLEPGKLAKRILELLGAENGKSAPREYPRGWVGWMRFAGLLTEAEEHLVRKTAEEQGLSELESVIGLGVFPDQEQRYLWELHHRTDSVDLERHHSTPEVLGQLSEALCVHHRVYPVTLLEDTLVIAAADPGDVMLADFLAAETGYRVQLCYASPDRIEAAIMLGYSGRELHEQAERLVQERLGTRQHAFLDDRSLEEVVSEKPITEYVDSLLFRAVHEQASDIHLETTEEHLLVRLRIDGMLHDFRRLPPSLSAPIIARVKVLAGMDVIEKRLPQDGRFDIRVQGRQLDFRVSTVPCVEGEKLVIRVLNTAVGPDDLSGLGMEPEQVEIFCKVVDRPYGMVLVTGPTGSGKTTTLYGALRRLSSPELNIVTVEDPVEFRIPRANQIQVNPKIGLNFANVMRNVLRQDPNVIMVGEIRDSETAELASQAALTGHLVLSTLHTNDAPSSLIRLLDLGLPPYIVSSTVVGVLAQRLARRICFHCRREDAPTRIPGLEGEIVYRGQGCPRCRKTGYSGRTGVFELMPVSYAIRSSLAQGPNLDELRQLALAEGMLTLREAARRKVASGVTSVAEMNRLTSEIDFLEVPH
ncbi:MAG: Flp pilus assembly complex ATPase component TadA [Armatimonadetes bacterium]|nr:Flp pilus assembly complex ATPase component TadA [Armatimonadota bacterium]